jgi:hypothetical protein
MASYIEGYSDQQMPPPYNFEDVTIWSFPLFADLTKVQDIINRYLGGSSDPGSVRFELITSTSQDVANNTLVYMTVLDYGKMRSDWGYLSQKEFYFALPMIRTGGDVQDIVLFVPYIFVDNSWSMICGNTVVGFPKQLAWFRIGGSLRNPYPIGIDTQVFVKRGPDTPQTWQSLAQISSRFALGAIPSGRSLWPFGDIDQLYGPSGAFPVSSRIFDLFTFRLQQATYDAVQLKQFLNAQQPPPPKAKPKPKASYKARVSFTMQIQAGGTWGFLPAASVSLPAYDSLTIAADLGLIKTGRAYHPVLPFWISCNFNCQDAKEIALP